MNTLVIYAPASAREAVAAHRKEVAGDFGVIRVLWADNYRGDVETCDAVHCVACTEHQITAISETYAHIDMTPDLFAAAEKPKRGRGKAKAPPEAEPDTEPNPETE